MRSWEPHLSFTRGSDTERYGADLYRQPLWRYLFGRFTYRAWMWLHALAPHVFEPHGCDWRLALELACTYDIPHRGRELIATVDLPGRPKDWPRPTS